MHTGCSGLNRLNFYLGPFLFVKDMSCFGLAWFCYTFPTLFPIFGDCVCLLQCS